MEFIVILLVGIFSALLVIAGFDIIPAVSDMLCRRGIGTYTNPESWFFYVNKTAEKWLDNGVPAVPKNAGNRLKFIDYVKGDYKVDAIRHWQEASLLLAINETSPETADRFIQKALSQSGTFESDRVDTAMLAFAVICNERTDKDKIKPFMDSTAETLLKKYRRTGGIPYNNDDKIFFVDTIGLACPFLIRYACEYGNTEALNAALKAIKDYKEKGFHKELGLPAHCYNEKSGAPLGIYGWGRGCGWWASGLADCHIQLSRFDGYDNEKAMLLSMIEDFAKSITGFLHSNGAVDRNVLHHSGEDSSATAMTAYFLAYAGKVTGNSEYTSAAVKAIKFIFSVTRKDGTVDYSQGDTIGVGFYSAASIVVPAAQGFALRTYSMLKEGESF